jgi:hypothetical protein
MGKAYTPTLSLFGWLVADDRCWFVLREDYCWLVAGGWFVLRGKYCWLVADKPSEQGDSLSLSIRPHMWTTYVGMRYNFLFNHPAKICKFFI